MADTAKKILSVIATTSERLPYLTIKNGQLIFVQDRQRIALDFGDTRKFYNQIEIVQTESERLELTNPVFGFFYFVVETVVLWTYQNGWIQVTTPPDKIVFIGTTFPQLGSKNILYVNTADKSISVWDDKSQLYMVVANKTESITNEDIESLFINQKGE